MRLAWGGFQSISKKRAKGELGPFSTMSYHQKLEGWAMHM